MNTSNNEYFIQDGGLFQQACKNRGDSHYPIFKPFLEIKTNLTTINNVDHIFKDRVIIKDAPIQLEYVIPDEIH
jgi:hypothetical protein